MHLRRFNQSSSDPAAAPDRTYSSSGPLSENTPTCQPLSPISPSFPSRSDPGLEWCNGERFARSLGVRTLSLGICELLDVMKLGVINMQSAILRFFQDIVEGGVPTDVLAGILGP